MTPSLPRHVRILLKTPPTSLCRPNVRPPSTLARLRLPLLRSPHLLRCQPSPNPNPSPRPSLSPTNPAENRCQTTWKPFQALSPPLHRQLGLSATCQYGSTSTIPPTPSAVPPRRRCTRRVRVMITFRRWDTTQAYWGIGLFVIVRPARLLCGGLVLQSE